MANALKTINKSTMKRGAYKRILDIDKTAWDEVEVEYFNMLKNHPAHVKRKIHYTPNHPTMEGYIEWEGKKKDISALIR